ncbi:MAG: SUMF1/EgtB/PvdO family nonheme iron enzyme [Desulfomonile tiedjei]|nr:SUMF1/EgtB/PvdO family nonheme iron enzyme [Desulfomonile tiedjei]
MRSDHTPAPASKKAAKPLFHSSLRYRAVIKKKVIIAMCCAVTISFCFVEPLFVIGITNENYHNVTAVFPPSPSRLPHAGVAPHELAPKDCGLDIVRLIAAAEEAQPEVTGNTATVSTAGLSERARIAGELLVAGEAARAKEVIQEAIRECESGQADVRDCSQWMRSLQGLNYLLGKPADKIVVSNSIGQKMVRIPAGDYMMGSPKRETDWLRLTFKKIWREGHKQWFQDELPLHPVRITRSFYIGATEVTVGQFRQFVKDTKHKTDAEKGDGGMIFSKKEGRWVPQKEMKWDSVPWKISDDQPVVFVSWNDAQAFCRWLTRKEKRTYRLPTEAEWEMACRGGSSWVRFPWGDRLPGDRDMNFGDGNPKLPESLTTVDDGYEYVAPVGSFPPNGYGLYDMEGNVMEWVNDRYERNYYENSPIEDPTGPGTGSGRVNKGGNWYASPADCRCAFRGFSGPEMSFWNLGFRVVMEDKEDPGKTATAGGADTKASSGKSQTSASFPPSEDDGLRLFRQAMFAAQQQQWDNATEDLEQALKISEKREDDKWVARVKATLAGIYAERNRTYKSKELYTQSLAEFRKIGDTTSARIILARLEELESSPGVKVAQVKKGGIADKAGIVAGDVIIEYAGETGFRVIGFKKLVEEFARAEQVTLSIINNGEISTAVVPGGVLGVAVEDIKRPPRPQRPPEQRPRERQRPRPRGDRR